MSPEITQQLPELTRQLIQILYKGGLALFVVILFKDIISDFAQNMFLYFKMRIDKKTYSAEGGKIQLDGETYVIISLTFGYIHLRKLGNGKRCRITAKDYWNSRIFYIDNRESKKGED